MPAAATIGDNGKGNFFHHFNKISAQRAIVDRERAEEKRLRKVAKADGLKLANIDFAIRAVRLEDDSIIVEEMRERERIAAWLGLPIGTAPAFSFDAEPIGERAAREGTAAGMMNRDRDSPYDANTEPGRAWLKAYDKARREQLAFVADALEEQEEEVA